MTNSWNYLLWNSLVTFQAIFLQFPPNQLVQLIHDSSCHDVGLDLTDLQINENHTWVLWPQRKHGTAEQYSAINFNQKNEQWISVKMSESVNGLVRYQLRFRDSIQFHQYTNGSVDNHDINYKKASALNK